jgi:intraflagellar transport protein 122
MDLAIKVLKQLAYNSSVEKRFSDSSLHYYQLSLLYLSLLPNDTDQLSDGQKQYLIDFNQNQSLAEIYNAYGNIYKYLNEPFTTHLPETIFNMCVYLLYKLSSQGEHHGVPDGISFSSIIFVLAKQAMQLSAYKTARIGYDRLRTMLIIPNVWREEVERLFLILKGRPPTDDKTMLRICYNCGNTRGPSDVFLRKDGGYSCVSCGEVQIPSFYSFEPLGIVSVDPKKCEIKTNDKTTTDILEIGQKECDNHDEHIFIIDWKKPSIPKKYYKSVSGNNTMCEKCFKFYHSEDYEFLGYCAFCKNKSIEE